MNSLEIRYLGKNTELQNTLNHLDFKRENKINEIEEINTNCFGYEKEIAPIYSEQKGGGFWRVLPLDHQKAISASYDHKARLCSLEETTQGLHFKNIQILGGHKKEVLSLTKVTDKLFATGSADGKISFWEAAKGKHMGSLQEHIVRGFYSMTAIDENTIATGSCHKPKKHQGSWDYVIKIWDIVNKNCKFELKGHQDGISNLVSLGENLIASSSDDKTVRIWNLAKKAEVAVFKCHNDWVYGLATLNNEQLITASKDKTMKIFDISNGKQIGQFQTKEGHAHESSIYDVNTLENHIAVSASRDGYVKLWDCRSLECIKSMDADDGFVYSADFFPDGKIIAGTAGKIPTNQEKRRNQAHMIVWDFRYFT